MLPVENYTAELRVDRAGEGESVVTWSAHFDVTSGAQADGVQRVRGFFTAGLSSLEKRFG